MKRILLVLLICLSRFTVLNCDYEQDYSFILLINHNSEYSMAKFNLEDLKKCYFPEGPLRANIPVVEEFQSIDENVYLDLQRKSTPLQIFCIEDGSNFRRSINEDPITLKKCSFEVPGQSHLHYVFCIKEDIKNVSGHIILRSELDSLEINDKIEKTTILQDSSTQETQNLSNDEEVNDDEDETSFEHEIDDPTWEIVAKKEIEDKTSVITKAVNYSKLLALVLYIQYLKIKDYFGLSSDLPKPNNELEDEKLNETEPK